MTMNNVETDCVATAKNKLKQPKLPKLDLWMRNINKMMMMMMTAFFRQSFYKKFKTRSTPM